MKGIYDILKDNNITIPEDFDKAKFEKELNGNYKSIEELKKKDDTIASLTDQLNTAKDGLAKFDGVNVEELNGKIKELTDNLTKKDEEWQGKLSAIEFDNILESAITNAKGKNAKAIKALLDIDTLKGSNNRTEDIKGAIEKVKTENEYLFESEKTPPKFAGGAGTGASNGENNDPQLEAFRRALGIKEKK